jgi:hypothetical protein
LHEAFQAESDPDTLLEALRHLKACSKLLWTREHTQRVLALACDRKGWLQPLTDWRPESPGPDAQFVSLARHLYARYPVPGFLDGAWLSGDKVQLAWFKHIGAGKNIRTAPDLPVPLTRRMAH